MARSPSRSSGRHAERRRGGPSSRRGGRDRDNASRRSPPRFPPPHQDADSWRPADKPSSSSSSDPRRRSYHDDHRAAADSYRPRVPQGDFTFRSEKPLVIPDFAPDSAPSGPRIPQRGNTRGRRPMRDRRSGGRWQGPQNPSERALMMGLRTDLPEENLHNGEGAKFRNLDDLSDDDELDMDISSQSESEGPAKKRTKTEGAGEGEGGGDSSLAQAVKWSNPDPYTALPCPDDDLRKKRDVVKLIRKARLEDTSNKPAVSTEAENFISFDLSDSDSDAQSGDEDGNQDQHEDDQVDSDVIEVPQPPTEPPPPLPRGAPPPLPSSLPKKPDVPQNWQDPLGSRKRTHDDVIKPPDYGQLKKVKMAPSKGQLVSGWEAKSDQDPCPWATVDHSATSNVAFRLHKEIMDFYEYVRPKKFEQTIRDSLVDNLKKAMRRDGRNFASAHLLAFGSFKSGLYLPTADMDLVVCSASFMRGGPPTYLGARGWLYKFQKLLVAQQVADQDSIEVIAYARIPLVKFVDRITGLKVDVSFENLGGVDAIKTFLRWKDQYPAMPILVTVVKHFLLMRGLNEPVNGGIGGYSVICLVVSMLQLMPQVQSRSLIPEHHLGEMLLEFLDLYGSKFRYEVNAISLSRPVGYIRKNEVSTFSYKNRDRLSIIDPNNRANDISGGSSNTPTVLARFQEANEALRQRMREVGEAPSDGNILEVILRGDYSSFQNQRGYLRHLHEKYIGPCID